MVVPSLPGPSVVVFQGSFEPKRYSTRIVTRVVLRSRSVCRIVIWPGAGLVGVVTMAIGRVRLLSLQDGRADASKARAPRARPVNHRFLCRADMRPISYLRFRVCFRIAAGR